MSTQAPPVRPRTLGECRVRITFNPSADDGVNKIKQQTATLIDLCDMLSVGADGEAKRCYAIAMSKFEDAAMWAVQGLTLNK